MPVPPAIEIDARNYAECLRYAIVETWRQLQILVQDPQQSPFTDPTGYIPHSRMLYIMRDYMRHMIQIGEWRASATPPPFRFVQNAFRGQRWSDESSMFRHVPVMATLDALDQFLWDYGLAWDAPAEGVFDRTCQEIIATFEPWNVEHERRFQEHVSASRRAQQAEAAARMPPFRHMPHEPHLDSLLITRDAAAERIRAFVARLPGSDNLGDPNADEARSLAEQHLVSALIGHWLLAEPAVTLAALRQACDYAQRGVPTDPALHAWSYEQWQHVAICCGHTGLSDTLWSLRREAWDHRRIRPVNWLVCRIRVLDLLHHDGLDSEIRGVLDMGRIGLFDDPLPSELEPDVPLMRCWHHLLHAIVQRDTAGFDQRLAERQVLLAEHWKRGGGIAAASLLDLGGLALVRTAQRCGMPVALADGPYLPVGLQQT